MSDKYTYADVIINPNDPRVEIGKEYYGSCFPAGGLNLANMGIGFQQLVRVDKDSSFGPFVLAKKDDGVESFPCLIRKKEPEKKYVPFDLSREEDRARLRGAWVRHKQNPERENLITGLGDETVDFAVYFGDVAIGTGVLLENFEFVDGFPCGKLVEEE